VKLYVDEAGRPEVVSGLERAAAVATVRISYAEARAAFARLQREGGVTAITLRGMVRDLDRDWGSYNVVEVAEPLVRHAGTLAERHALRGCDAVQLAAALVVRRAAPEMEFATFDERLEEAAAREGLTVMSRGR
jgi:predicted nucleic acid-binding protein